MCIRDRLVSIWFVLGSVCAAITTIFTSDITIPVSYTHLDVYKRQAPSFKRYIVEHHPKHALRFSKRGYCKNGEITNIPLYLVGKTKNLL